MYLINFVATVKGNISVKMPPTEIDTVVARTPIYLYQPKKEKRIHQVESLRKLICHYADSFQP